jgi:hypothetical protein
MKVLVFLSILMGILLSLLIYFASHYFNGANVQNPHLRVIGRTSEGALRTLCFGNVEYLLVNANSSVIIPALDVSGKPRQCNY